MIVTQAADAVLAELANAKAKHPRPFASPHEGFGVLYEEMDELLDEIRANDLPRALIEAKQVAAMAMRFMVELG